MLNATSSFIWEVVLGGGGRSSFLKLPNISLLFFAGKHQRLRATSSYSHNGGRNSSKCNTFAPPLETNTLCRLRRDGVNCALND
jgi:hypothetical protein